MGNYCTGLQYVIAVLLYQGQLFSGDTCLTWLVSSAAILNYYKKLQWGISYCTRSQSEP
jgi:hypothetical protein